MLDLYLRNILHLTIQLDQQTKKTMKTLTFKKGQPLKIQLPNGKKFDLTFVDYHSIKGLAFGKFQDEDGEFDVKPFNLDAII